MNRTKKVIPWKAGLIFILLLSLGLVISNVFGDSEVFKDHTVPLSDSRWIKTSTLNTSGTIIQLDKTIKHSREESLKISNTSADYSRYSIPLILEPNSDYQISCWVKTDGIGLNATGACLSIEGQEIALSSDTYIKPLSNNGKPQFSYISPNAATFGPRHVCSTDLTGKNNIWQNLQLHIITGEQDTNVKLGFELGRPGRENSGTAWFSDLAISRTSITNYKNIAILLQLLVFSLLLIAMAGAVFPTLLREPANKKQKKSTPVKLPQSQTDKALSLPLLIAFFVFAFIVRLYIAFTVDGHVLDLYCFKSWSSAAAERLFGMYSSGIFIDYPPLYLYVLALLGKIAAFTGIYTSTPAYYALLKLPSIFAELFMGYLIYRLAKPRFSYRMTFLLLGLFLFSAVLILDSCAWAQVDSFFALLIVLSLVLLVERRVNWASFFIAFAVLMKPQGLIFLPVFFFVIVKQRKAKTFLTAVFTGFCVIFITALPFMLVEGPLWIIRLYTTTLGEYTKAVQGAYNLFALLGGSGISDEKILFLFSYRAWGFFFIVAATLLTGFFIFRSDKEYMPILGALMLFTSVYMLSTRIHERYLLPALPLLLILYIFSKDSRLLFLYGSFSFTLFQSIDSMLFRSWNPPIQAMSFISVFLYIWLMVILASLSCRENINSQKISST